MCFNITKLVVVGLFTYINILLLKGRAACTEHWKERVKKKKKKAYGWQQQLCGNRKNSSLS